jgi:hypothetical protein
LASIARGSADEILIGDEDHEPHAPPLIFERISITVQEGGPGGPDQ